jgi:protein TonB
MFANLIESASHQQDLARKGRFFLATLISYALIVACAGLASIYAYDASVENQDLEFLGLVPPIVPDAETPVPKNTAARPKTNSGPKNTVPIRTVAIERVATGTIIPNGVSAIKSDVPEIPIGQYKLGSTNIGDGITGPTGDDKNDGTGDGGSGALVKIETPPPVKDKTVVATQPKVVRTSTILNGKATYLPKPPYPPLAKQARVSGPVNVQVMIDETGKIATARATSGNPLLHKVAEQAAYQARFKPTLLNDVPVKVTGIITYNFTLQ